MIDINQFRAILIQNMCKSGLLKDNWLGSGCTDWHSEEGKAGITFELKTGESFSVIIDSIK